MLQKINADRACRQLQPGHLGWCAGDDLPAADHGQSGGAHAQGLDRVTGLQQHQIGPAVAAAPPGAACGR